MPNDRPGRIEWTVSYQDLQYAADGGTDVHVFLMLRATGLGAAVEHSPERAEVIIIDCSGTMAVPFVKIAEARKAAVAAISLLPDGTHFALVEGTERARVAYPWVETGSPRTAVAGPGTRASATFTARRLNAFGGTAIATWLDLARRLLEGRQASLRHVLLLTDGRDEHDKEGELERVLDACAGQFTCDTVGIGDEYDAAQLTRISSRLHGTASAVVDESTLPEQFSSVVLASTSRRLPDLTLRVSSRPGVAVTLFRQLNPTVLDLTGTAREEPDGALLFPTGAWGDETRWYELRLRAEPDASSFLASLPQPSVRRDEGPARIAELELRAEDVTLPPRRPVDVRWTEERPPPTHIAAAEHFARCQELNTAAQRGCAAHQEGDFAEAARWLGTAVRLAHELGDTRHLERLAPLVVIEDAAAGRVAVRQQVDRRHIQALLVSTSHTTPPQQSGPPGPPKKCPTPDCEELSPADANFCQGCRYEFAS